MDERPNAIKNGVGKIGNMAARSKRKIEEKNGEVIYKLPLSDLIRLRFWTNPTESQTNYICEWLTADQQLIRRKALLILSARMDENVRRGVAGYRWRWWNGLGGDGGKLAASAGCCAGLRRLAAGAAESV